jgi:HlyD family secretion protein
MTSTKRRLAWVVLALLLAAGGGAAYLSIGGDRPAEHYRTAAVDRGPVVATVSATGQLAAVTTVLVGSQVSGQIRELYADFNSPVARGQLIARIDPAVFQARVAAAAAEVDNVRAAVLNQRANVRKAGADVESARAGAASAAANVARMRADVENARAAIASAHATVARETAKAANARRELERRLELAAKQLIAESDKDQAQTAWDTAEAELEAARSQERAAEAALRSAEAQLTAAESQARAATAAIAAAAAAAEVAAALLAAADANVRQKQAALDQARLDLSHTEIRAPVDGVVVSRNVDVGQTVAASLQAPTLFSIAEDLTRMQVEAAIDEADVGRLRRGLPVTFTVDAFPGRVFRGEIVQIRQAPQVIQNVVTYTTVVAVANPEKLLMPGMTANVRIEIERKPDVLRVPTAALRFRPPGDTDASGAARVFVVDEDGTPRAIAVVVGLTDGTSCEVAEGALAPGQHVIVADTTAAPRPGGTPRLRL